jgi:hypothetical protein
VIPRRDRHISRSAAEAAEADVGGGGVPDLLSSLAVF